MSVKRFILPKSIRVGPHSIKVRYVEEISDADHDEVVLGMWSVHKLEIQIRANMEPTLEWETFWHEVMECINEVTDAGLPHHFIQTSGLLLSGIAGEMKTCSCGAIKVKKNSK